MSLHGRWLTLAAACVVILLTGYLLAAEPSGTAWGATLVALGLAPAYMLCACAHLAKLWVEGAAFPRFPSIMARFAAPHEPIALFGLGKYDLPDAPLHQPGEGRALLVPLRAARERGIAREDAIKACAWSWGTSVWELCLVVCAVLLCVRHVDMLPTTEAGMAFPSALSLALGLAQATLLVAGACWAGWSGVVRRALEARAGASVAEALQAQGYRRHLLWGWYRPQRHT